MHECFKFAALSGSDFLRISYSETVERQKFYLEGYISSMKCNILGCVKAKDWKNDRVWRNF